jgi:hypothetical protein
MKSTYLFIIYGTPEVRKFNGILGEIDFYTFQFLLAGGKYLVEEEYNGKDPVAWYKNVLEEQDIFVKNTNKQKFKNKNIIWLEVDTSKTPIHEFTSYSDLDEKDESTLAWRKIYFPCSANTSKECLGLAVVAREIPLSPKNKHGIYLFEVLHAILSNQNSPKLL